MHVRHTTSRIAAALAAALALVAVPATSAAATESTPDGAATTVATAGGVDYDLWRQDVAAVAAEARPWLEARTENAGAEKQAIVLDIDNTALETQLHPLWVQPVPAVADVRDLARYADSRGVAVFFVTARPDIVRALTQWNLEQVGYPVAGLHVRNLPDIFDEPGAYKTQKRAEIEAEGYKIIANIGNSDSDIVGGYAERTFKLPDYGGKLF
ncbi:HAD family acid phosphatase [Streptomyces cyaneofuscatus]|uniref:HAD family acid phosphatase n=1 Tax=Streptomyces cyaneofuscatus TaxID=66883 RepID=UPI00368E4CF4